jgi:hypothetical protein
VAGNRSARLLDQQPSNVIELTLERQLLLHHRRPGRRQHTARDHVADFTFGMRTDDRNHAARR